MVRFTVITLFPEMFSSPLGHSILKKARENGLIRFSTIDPRSYATDRHHTTDDYPYGGGQGMVMKPEPLVAAIEAARSQTSGARVILLTPRGEVFRQATARRLAGEPEIVLVCGRYEGVDERVKSYVDEEISIGDYTLSGGEPAAIAIIDAVARLVPGVLGNSDSALEESFTDGLLEYPQYTRPEEYRGVKVPEVLLSGDHERIRQWRRQQSLAITRVRRPDLYARAVRTLEQADARHFLAPVYVALLHFPVYDKNGQVVTTAVTNMDVHDIARAGCTYGVRGLFIVTPVKALQRLALKIIEHWESGYGSRYNTTRRDALAIARVCDTYDDAIIGVERENEAKPTIIATSARRAAGRASFAQMRDMLHRETRPCLILFGTGWGLTEAILSQSDYVLEPIEGRGGYNHLSVRSAAAIVLDRLLGPGRKEE